MNDDQVRQGDVFLVRRTQLPTQAAEVDRDPQRGIVLALGEVTGHAHVITEEWAKLFEAADGRYVVLSEEATLRHEEHGPISLAPGIWRVVIQREWEGESLYVAD